jgi:hypothetical protein
VNINLTIERLILDGLNIEPSHGALVKTAVEAELSRLLTQAGLAPGLRSGGVFPRVRAHSIQVSPGDKPTQVGRHIARAIYKGVNS